MLMNDKFKLMKKALEFFLRGDEIIQKCLNTRTVLMKSAETGISD